MEEVNSDNGGFATDTKGDTVKNENVEMIPKSRLTGLAKENDKYKARLAELEQAEAQRLEVEAIKKGEYESLLSEYKSKLEGLSSELEQYKSKSDKFTKQLENKNNELIESLPEEAKDLIPSISDPVELNSWLSKFSKKFNSSSMVEGGFSGQPRAYKAKPLTADQVIKEKRDQVRKHIKGLK